MRGDTATRASARSSERSASGPKRATGVGGSTRWNVTTARAPVWRREAISGTGVRGSCRCTMSNASPASARSTPDARSSGPTTWRRAVALMARPTTSTRTVPGAASTASTSPSAARSSAARPSANCSGDRPEASTVTECPRAARVSAS